MTVELTCPECGEPMALRSSQFGLFWGCTAFPKCTGTHGAHRDGTPLGVPANQETKRARRRAHATFDALWKRGDLSRKEAYDWLRSLPLPDHIAKMNVEECDELIARVKERNEGTRGS
jgi:ssDNA-binding Zn-finger/Zn-ribbon topoisomerase 1